MIGIDTNILVRWLLRDDDVQFAKVEALLAGVPHEHEIFISPFVIMEAIWVLENGYKLPFSKASDPIFQVLQSEGVHMGHSMSIGSVSDCLVSPTRGFSDMLIASTNLENGCKFTYTFDRQAAQTVPGMELLD